MAKVRVPVVGTVGKSVRINPDATQGAIFGTDLFKQDGTLLTIDDLILSLPAPEVNDVIFEEQIVDGTILARVADAETITGQYTFEARVDIDNGAALRIHDAGDTDYVQFQHDGTDFNLTGVNTASLNVSGINSIQAALVDAFLADITVDSLTIGTIGLADTTVNGLSGATLVGVAALAGATNTQLQRSIDNIASAGEITGGEITASATANAVDVAAGTGYIRAADVEHSEIIHFDWSALNAINIPDGSVRYIGVEYNAGSPQIVVRVTDTWDLNTEFPLGIAGNQSGTRHITNIPWHSGDISCHLLEFIDSTKLIYRDERQSGLVLGETGTRNVTVTAGNLMERTSQFPFSAFDSSGADSFITIYRDGVGGHVDTSGTTQWPNTQYDDGSGTLATLATNKYANLWFYIGVDGDVYCVYGTVSHNNVGQAEEEAPPTDVPNWFARHTLLIGRLTFQETGATASTIVTAFDTVFTSASISDHGALSGLIDDDHTQYLLADGTRALDGTLTIRDVTLAGSAAFSHDGVDFNAVFVNTTLWNIGVGLNITGPITATSYEGIAAADILSRNVAETINSNWHFEGTNLFIQPDGTTTEGFRFGVSGDITFIRPRNAAGTGWDAAADLLYDRSDNRWKFDTNLSVGGGLITPTLIANWDTAFGWGDFSTSAVLLSGAAQALLGTYHSTNNADVDGANFSVDTTTKSGVEYAYEVLRSGVTVGGFTILGNVVGANLNISDWDTAFGWGNHASVGYVTSSGLLNVVEDTTPQLGGTLDVNGKAIQFGDNAELRFGDAQEIKYDFTAGNNLIIELAATVNGIFWQLDGLTKFNINFSDSLIQIRDGYKLRISDSGDTDWGEFYHDGTDFKLDFTNTGWVRLNGTTSGFLFLNGPSIRQYAAANANWVNRKVTTIETVSSSAGITAHNYLKPILQNNLGMPYYVSSGYVGGKITVAASAPGTPAKGDIWYDTT